MYSKKILLLGAGKSSYTLIHYLMQNAEKESWQISIGDKNIDSLSKKVNWANVRLIDFNIDEEEQLQKEISMSDIVISMLPASFHPKVANACVSLGKSMVTASYVSPELQKLNNEAERKNIILLNEIGLDPGLDHLSAMNVIDGIRDKGGEMLNFESFTGGLLSPESESNPWKYKFTWNPRNVVLAGQGTVKFIQEGRYKYIPYQKLFRRTEIIEIEGYGKFEGYANRDSLKYLDVYNLRGINTLYRGTLRRPGFCRAWDVFVQLGATDDSYVMEGSENLTHRQFINSFLSYNPHDSVELKLMHYLKIDQDSDLMEKLEWLGVFEDKKVGIKNATPAQILQHILEQKWTLNTDDKDMIVMWHLFDYKLGGKLYRKTSSVVVLGEDDKNTAMAKTVGLPLGIAVKMILENKISLKGTQVPITPEIYQPILAELEHMDISFHEQEIQIN